MQMTNLELSLEPETTLFKEEVDAIIAVVMNTIDNEPYVRNRDIHDGSFLFYGMADDGEEPQKIIAFDFENGPTENLSPYSGGDYGNNSREIADAVLARELDDNKAKDDSVITWFCESPPFLSFRTTHGRFACACFGDRLFYKPMIHIYCAVVQAVACMGLEDTVLQDSCDKVFSSEICTEYRAKNLRSRVKKLFRECKLPELARWKKWHSAEDENLTLFFE